MTPFPSDLDDTQLDRLLLTLADEFAADAAEHDLSGTFPHRNFERLHEHGLLALTVPRALGGSGAGLRQASKVIRGVARGDPSTALVLAMQYLAHSGERQARWPSGLYERVAADAVREGALTNSLRVEPELGTPARGGLPGTIARRTEQGWRISGRKIYSTGAPRLTWMAVWARSDDADPLVGAWLVHRETPGIAIVETWNHLGMRASGSHEVVFDDVLVPVSHALNPVPASQTPVAMEGAALVWGHVLVSGVYDSVARSARDWFVQWLRDRVPGNLGAPLASVARFQEAVGQIETWLLSNQVLLEAAISGSIGPAEGGRVKLLVTQQSIQVVELALKLSGNPGLSRGNPLERHYRNVLCGRVHTPQDDVVLASAGRLALQGARA
jgi:alkylation response protein AidB-like acyl-CoA dehydrogenase